MNRILAFVFGLAAYIVFLGTFLYAIGLLPAWSFRNPSTPAQ